MEDENAPGKSSSARPGEKKSKTSKKPGESAPVSSSIPQPSAESRLPPSGFSKREAITDDDQNRYQSSSSSSSQPGRPKERVVRETVSIRSISPNPNDDPTRRGRDSSSIPIPSSTFATSQSQPHIPTVTTKKSSPLKKKTQDPDDDYEDYADDFDEIEEEEETPPPKPVIRAPVVPINNNTGIGAGAKSNRPPMSGNNTGNTSEVDLHSLRKSMEEENTQALARKQFNQEESKAAAKSSGENGDIQPSGEKKRSKQTPPDASSSIQPSNAIAPGKGKENISSFVSSQTQSTPANNVAPKQSRERFISLGLSLNSGNLAQSLDPRARRLAKLLASGVLDLQEEKVTQLNITSSTAYDQYHRMLRAQIPIIKQAGHSSTEETRDVEVNTDEVMKKDREIQFTNGDDTKLLNLITAVEERRAAKRRNETLSETLLETAERISVRNTTRVIPKQKDEHEKNFKRLDMTEGSTYNGKSTGTSGSGSLGGVSSSTGTIPNSSASLSVFLRKASGVCETLLEENRHNQEDGETSRHPQTTGLFGPSSQWYSLGAGLGSTSGTTGNKDTDNEEKSSERKDRQGLGQGQGNEGHSAALATRMTVALRFSPLQPHILITAHRHSFDEGDDMIDETKGGVGHAKSKTSAHATSADRNSAPLTLDPPKSLKPTHNALASKGIYCVWDVTAPAVPLHVLAAVGQPSAVCFSVAQTFLVLAGTCEGGLHLWDLREGHTALASHKQQHGFKKPCFSTRLTLGGTGAGELKGGNGSGGSLGIFDSPGLGGQHTSAIAQVEPLGEADWSVSAVASQFASVDVEGVVILWMSSAATPTSLAHRGDGPENTASKNQLTYITSSTPSSNVGTNGIPISDLTRSISGTVTLLQLKVIRRDTGLLSSQPSFSPAASALSKGSGNNNSNNLLNKYFDLSLASETAVLATVPSDLSSLLLSETHGKVVKITRFGEPSAPKRFYRPESDRIEVAVQGVVASRHFNRDIINSALGTGEDLDDDGRSEGKHEVVREKSALLLGDKKVDFFSIVTCMSVRPNVISTSGGVSSSSSSLERNSEGKSVEKEGKESEDEKNERGDGDGNNTIRRENTTAHPPLLLVGRADGTLDLFRMDACEPLQTWTLSDHLHRIDNNSGSPSRNNRGKDHATTLSMSDGTNDVSVVGVKWVPSRASAFVAVDNAGRCFYFDLLVNHDKPLHVENLNCINLRGGLRVGNTDLSCCRPHSRIAYLAVGNSTSLSGSGGSSASTRIGVVVRRLAEGIIGGRDNHKGSSGGGSQSVSSQIGIDDEKLRRLVNRWASHTNVPQVTAILKSGGTMRSLASIDTRK